jgi:CheY-like chemotaxis protein
VAFKILLADDSVTAQNLAKKILTDVGYDVVAVSNGAAAMKKITSERPDLLILDVYMPGYTGLEICEKVKGAAETAGTPVLLTVAPMEPFNPADSNRVRADGVILKPFEARDLLPAVEKLQERTAASRGASIPPQNAEARMAVRREVESTSPEEMEGEPEAEESRPAPLPELPQELAVAPAFLEQFGEEMEAAPPAPAEWPDIIELGSAVADAVDHGATAFSATLESAAASPSLQEFDLPSASPSHELAPEVFLPEVQYGSSSREDMAEAQGSAWQTELEADARNASLGEMGFAAGLPPEVEDADHADLDLSPPAVARDADETVLAPDLGLMDRTEMVELATRFQSDTTESDRMEDVSLGTPFGDETGDRETDGGTASFAELALAESSGCPDLEEAEISSGMQPEFLDSQQAAESAGPLPMEACAAEPELAEAAESAAMPKETPQEATAFPEFAPSEMLPSAAREVPASATFSQTVEREGWPARDVAFGATDEIQFFQAAVPAQAEPAADATSAGPGEIDERVLEEAIARVLDRIRPQILSELVRELRNPRG